MVAGFSPDGLGTTAVGTPRVLGEGVSPALAAFPDGDLLLVYTTGTLGAHRVVAQRLGRGLEPRGEPLVLTPETADAVQPVAAVRPDGRVLVAFFTAERGRRTAVQATPLACDPGL
jgi:hypothetical protein